LLSATSFISSEAVTAGAYWFALFDLFQDRLARETAMHHVGNFIDFFGTRKMIPLHGSMMKLIAAIRTTAAFAFLQTVIPGPAHFSLCFFSRHDQRSCGAVEQAV
jgi:hypothetical protein